VPSRPGDPGPVRKAHVARIASVARATVLRPTQWFFSRQGWAWLLPFFVYKVVRSDQSRILKGFEFMIGGTTLVAIVRRPYRALTVLLVVFPFQTLLLAGLLRLGAPASIVRGLRFWREAIILGLAIAAILHLRHQRLYGGRLRFDIVDKLVAAYVALGTAYLFFPSILVGTGPGAHLSLYTRELGWRGDVLYFAIFLICRHIGLTRVRVDALFRRVVAVGAIMALIGIFEFFDTHAWVNFINNTLRVPEYDQRINGTTNSGFQEVYGSFGGHHLVRIGTVLLDYLGAGFFFALCLGLAIDMVSRGAARWWIIASIPMIGTALVFNQGRAAIVAGAVAIVFGLRAQVGRSIVRRARLMMALGLILLLALPVALESGLGHRFVSASNSNSGHISAIENGLRVMQSDPLGRGLSTAAGAGQEATDQGKNTSFIVTEDQWLQIGTQLGFLGLGLYGAALIFMVRRLRPKPTDDKSLKAALSAAGARNALVGLLVAGFVLQPFVIDVVDWTLFALCGVAAGLLDSATQSREPLSGGLARETAYPRDVTMAFSLARPPGESY